MDCIIGVSRLTPTCVGTMIQVPIIERVEWAHPHMRGDNLPLVPRASMRAGSPPHAWGQYLSVRLFRLLDGLTPTCVGTIVCLLIASEQDWAHPHMRGDNLPKEEQDEIIKGSPPHAWGQSAGRIYAPLVSGLTPTCVGTILQRAHPHMRGDNKPRKPEKRKPVGSPPHAWGQLRCLHLLSSLFRLTPTCVGTILGTPYGL